MSRVAERDALEQFYDDLEARCAALLAKRRKEQREVERTWLASARNSVSSTSSGSSRHIQGL
jgi:hypothetical protein